MGRPKVASVMKTSHADEFEAGAGRVGAALIIAGDDGARPAIFEQHLCAAKDMPGGIECHAGLAALHDFAIGDPLAAAGKILAIADGHDPQRLLGREHGAMAGPRMVRMAMRDDGAVHGASRVDIGFGGRAIEALGAHFQPVFGMGRSVAYAHRRKVSSLARFANYCGITLSCRKRRQEIVGVMGQGRSHRPGRIRYSRLHVRLLSVPDRTHRAALRPPP